MAYFLSGAPNWSSQKLIGIDPAKRFSPAQLASRFDGRLVVVSGTPPVIQRVWLHDDRPPATEP